jgi:hypothetical protein
LIFGIHLSYNLEKYNYMTKKLDIIWKIGRRNRNSLFCKYFFRSIIRIIRSSIHISNSIRIIRSSIQCKAFFFIRKCSALMKKQVAFLYKKKVACALVKA